MSRRGSSVLAVLGLLALVPPLPARAADPLGGAIAPAPYYAASDGGRVLIFNRSQDVERFTVASGDGWTFAPVSFQLEPGERQSVSVTSVGTDGAEIAVLVESTEPTPAGVERGVLSLVTQLHSGERPSPLDLSWVVLCLAGLAALCVGISASWAIRERVRRRKHVW